mmetsp:Transcript_87600/g.281064  ORF Transcript_87600/g.281064 Transcript_87600/m.281064 type:complete len:314 (-) Transcript_87600:35-976(-)
MQRRSKPSRPDALRKEDAPSTQRSIDSTKAKAAVAGCLVAVVAVAAVLAEVLVTVFSGACGGSGGSSTGTGGWRGAPEWEDRWGKISCDVVDLRRGKPLTASEFASRFAALPQTPVIFRQAPPERALKLLAREKLLQLCGDVPVLVGKTGGLGLGGKGDTRTPLEQYLNEMRIEEGGNESERENAYLFDSVNGNFLRDCAALGIKPDPPINYAWGGTAETVIPTPSAFATVGDRWWTGHSTDLRLTIGRAGSGITLHQHAATYNWLFYGTRRWTLFPPNSTLNGAGWNPFASQLSWLEAEPSRWGFGDVLDLL